MKYGEWEVNEARESLAGLKPGDTIWTILRHRARSGMFRRISVLVFAEGEPRFLDWPAARLLGLGLPDDGEGIGVSGCGQDMGFHLVYELGRRLFPKGFKVAKNQGRNGDKSGRELDGGYAFKHRWL